MGLDGEVIAVMCFKQSVHRINCPCIYVHLLIWQYSILLLLLAVAKVRPQLLWVLQFFWQQFFSSLMHSNKRNVVVTRGLLVLVACKGGGTGGARGALAPPNFWPSHVDASHRSSTASQLLTPAPVLPPLVAWMNSWNVWRCSWGISCIP